MIELGAYSKSNTILFQDPSSYLQKYSSQIRLHSEVSNGYVFGNDTIQPITLAALNCEGYTCTFIYTNPAYYMYLGISITIVSQTK